MIDCFYSFNLHGKGDDDGKGHNGDDDDRLRNPFTYGSCDVYDDCTDDSCDPGECEHDEEIVMMITNVLL